MGITRQQIEGIVRHGLTFAGAIILVFFSGAENLVGEITAAGAMLAGVIWSIATKTGEPLTEKIKGVVNHSVAILTALLVYFGATDSTLSAIELVVGTIINLLPFILSFANKSK